MGFFRRSQRHEPEADAAPVQPIAPDPAVMAALYHPDYIPPEPIDYAGHRDEVDVFVEAVGAMNRSEAARVHRQAVASGATMSRRWAEVEAQLAAAAAQHGLEIGRIAAHHRADKALRLSPARFGNQYGLADYCAGIWAEVVVLRDHLESRIVKLAFEPWDGVLAPPEWMQSAEPARLD